MEGFESSECSRRLRILQSGGIQAIAEQLNDDALARLAPAKVQTNLVEAMSVDDEKGVVLC